MKTPSEAAEAAWNEFEKTIRGMSRGDYAAACEELSATCDASATCVHEEMEAEADHADADSDDEAPY